MLKIVCALVGAAVIFMWVLGALEVADFYLCFRAKGDCPKVTYIRRMT